ncbi:MAG: sigma 54-interacting transcriptional regulator [Spirochaetales bacterium]|nr:sigma 54-interacting transcriptional regulator [Spirochaetales bacterium]
MASTMVFVAPYADMANLARQYFSSLDDKIDVVVGDLDTGLSAARSVIASGAELIISRGGTAELIAAEVDVPVVPVRVSGYDVFRVLTTAFAAADSVGVVGFESVVAGCRSAAHILNKRLLYQPIFNSSDVLDAVSSLVDRGAQYIVGDMISVSVATGLGLPCSLLQSGVESIVQAVDEARQILFHLHRQRHQNALLQALLDNSRDAIVAVDDKGCLQFANEVARAVYHLSHGNEPRLPHLETVITEEAETHGELVNVGDRTLLRTTLALRADDTITGAMEISHDVTRLRELEQRVRRETVRRGFVARHTIDQLVGAGDEIRRVRQLARVLGRDDCNVLILGETGTGKELVAQGIHCASGDPTRPFVAINCAAIPSSLLESELFGYADGAFTGARKGGRPGLFEVAAGGTLFLDEIGEMNIEAQARLLRVLQERRVRRVGEDRVIPVRVRVIAASNVDLAAAENRFRRDLFYRLNVAQIRVPSLRERAGDIPLLIAHLVRIVSEEKGCRVPPMPDALVEIAQSHAWPGNVRELRNVCERYIVLVRSGVREEEMVHSLFAGMAVSDFDPDDPPNAFDASGMPSLKEITARAVTHTWRECGKNISRTARVLDIDRATVRRYVALESSSPVNECEAVKFSPSS